MISPRHLPSPLGGEEKLVCWQAGVRGKKGIPRVPVSFFFIKSTRLYPFPRRATRRRINYKFNFLCK
jgi:hypothetical protein